MPDKIYCTAWELLGKYSDIFESGEYNVVVVGTRDGKVQYEAARNTSGGRVVLSRLTQSNGYLHTASRIVKAETKVCLIRDPKFT